MLKKVNNVIYVDFPNNRKEFSLAGNSITPSEIRWFTAEGEIEQPVFQESQEETTWEHM